MQNKSLIPAITLSLIYLIALSAFKKKAIKAYPDNPKEEQVSFHQDNVKGNPKIQVVFALDATGSMSGLIHAAKEKIWGIASSMTQSDEAPVIEVGLLFYRDRGDAFVTQQVPLSQNLDDVYEKLMQIEAAGGGDAPESVNQALYESIEDFKWEMKQDNTYKTVFLVGDCPPHMDYSDDVSYSESCVLAKRKDIFLNTILMGNDVQAEKVWKHIANSNQGSFTKVDMNVNDIAITTPYDAEIAKLANQQDELRFYYGNEAEKKISNEKKEKSKIISTKAAPVAAAQRAEYNNTATGNASYYGKNELLNDIKENKVQIESLSETELPDEIKTLPKEERKKFVEKSVADKEALAKKMSEAVSKRTQYIEVELAKKDKSAVDNSFSNVIYQNIKQQSSKKNIQLKGNAKF